MGVLRNGEWQAFGDWCIMEELHEQSVHSDLIITTELSNKTKKGCGKHISGADVPAGTTLFFNEKFRSLYTVPDGRTFIIINKEYILAYS